MEPQPNPADFPFDLDTTLESIVSVRAQIPEDGLTAPILGTERSGHGVLIEDPDLILTVGYLVTEAESIWLVDYSGNTVPAHTLSYDQETGFGLVQALGPLQAQPMPLGRSSELNVGDRVIVAGAGGIEQAISTNLVGKREFAGHWEYVLDEALFTTPAHDNWSGAALIDSRGLLCGIGSLVLQTRSDNGSVHNANLMIPIDVLPPVLDDLRLYGRRNQPGRPWLGWFVQETEHGLVVAGLYATGPAAAAGINTGDVIHEVDGETIEDLASLFRTIWALGDAGIEIPITLTRDGDTHNIVVHSVDRYSCLKTASIH